MTEENIKYIKSITIDKLWGELDIYWELDQEVNILVGKNGVGKTTLLNLIEDIIDEKYGVERQFNLELFKIYFDDESSIFYNQERGFIEALSKKVNLCKISTFEMLVKDLQNQNYKKDENIKTELDYLLKGLIDDFKSYQLKLRNQEKEKTRDQDNEIKALSNKDSANAEELSKLRELLKQKDDIIANINQNQNRFLELINKLFDETNKKIDFDKENSIIFRKSNDKTISAYQLSSGEKQILIILLSILLQENKPFIVLMDEPEISLHLSWQLDLIDMIQQLNHNCQLIIATHAPGIISKGWQDKVIDMKNIIKD
ncbi:ATPase (fragment) [Planktothrix serta PCC 8927]|uniref:ATPase n=1 Tax=Planktothrix serta PCC 8927 TaxID=671068 RepID=A0A7Z9BK33_9CYAN